MTAPNKFCQQVAHGEPISVFGGGRAAAGWLHLDDATRATLAAANAEFVGYQPLNVVGEVASVGQVAAIVADAAEMRGIPAAVAGLNRDKLIDPASRFAVTSSLDGLSDARPRRSLRESIPLVLDHCLAQVDAARRTEER
jgi:nucleoside-diphosphate-sugar epimerase